MTVDEKIHLILEQIPFIQPFDSKAFCVENWGEEELNDLPLIQEKMLTARLIKVKNDGGIYELTLLGERLLANGGWLKFLEEREKSEQLQKEHESEYEAMKSGTNDFSVQKNSAFTSNQAPDTEAGMSFKNVLLLIGFLALLALVIWLIFD